MLGVHAQGVRGERLELHVGGLAVLLHEIEHDAVVDVGHDSRVSLRHRRPKAGSERHVVVGRKGLVEIDHRDALLGDSGFDGPEHVIERRP